MGLADLPLWELLEKCTQPDADCRIWTAQKDRDGYGRIKVGRSPHQAHRWAWVLANGQHIPEGMVVRHRCARRACVAPEHLELGTQDENMEDRDGHGHTARGSRNGRAKLSEDVVRTVRNRYDTGEVSFRALAAEMGLNWTTVRDIATRKTWAHVQ